MLVCRCCLTFEDNLYSLLDYEVAFQECMGLQVEESALICPSCIRKLYESHAFWVQTHKADDYLKNNKAGVVIKNEPVDDDETEMYEAAPVIVKIEEQPKKEEYDSFFDNDDVGANNYSSDDDDDIPLKTIIEVGENIKKEEPVKKAAVKNPKSIDNSIRAKEAWKNVKGNLIKECPFCLISVHTKPKLKKHIQEHLDANGGYGCAHCPKKLKSKLVLKQHIYNCHGVMLGLAGAENVGLLSCSECKETFKNSRLLRRHRKEQHTEVIEPLNDPYVCGVCQQGFNTKDELRIHETIHPGLRPFLCGSCGLGFKTKENMQTHELRHTGELNYSCDKCDKRYRTAASLKYHMTVHDETKNFSCDTCGKQFKQLLLLRSHLNVHIEKELKFACHVCGRRFKGENLLKSHLLVHDDNLRFSCDICGLKFRHRGSWKNHISLSHSEIREFGCGECGTAVKQKASLKRHMRQHAVRIGIDENSFVIQKGDSSRGFKAEGFLVRR